VFPGTDQLHRRAALPPRAGNRQRGATIVEAALTILLLFLFLDGVLEFGRMYNIYHVITNAAREGARFAVAPVSVQGSSPTSTQVQSTVQSFLDSAGVSGATVTVVRCQGTACNPVMPPVNGVDEYYWDINVTAPYSFVAPNLLGTKTIPTVLLQSDARMRDERNLP